MTAEPLMRITSIDLDEHEMPATVAVKMSWDVWDRLCRDHHAIRSVAQRDMGNLWHDRFPASWVAKVANFYGSIPPDGGTGSEIYACLSLLCCRFWEGGVTDALRELRVDHA